MCSNRRKLAYVVLAGLVVTSLTLLCIYSIGFVLLRTARQSKQEARIEQERVIQAAREISDTLYVPATAEVLSRFEGDELLAYAPGCVGTVIKITYGTELSFEDLTTAYDDALRRSGWVPRESYRHIEGYVVYTREPQEKLGITEMTAAENNESSISTPFTERFLTVYTVMITYTEPSNSECVG